MNLFFIVALHCCLAVLVHSAPVRVLDNPEFKRTTERVRTLVLKIHLAIPTVYGAMTVKTEGLNLDLSTLPNHLEIIRTDRLGIPDAPTLKPLSDQFTLESCVSRMAKGVQLYQDLLGGLATRLSGLTNLMDDLRDLLTQIRQMQTLAQLSDTEPYQSPDLASRLTGNFELEVATHQTLARLRIFCQDMVRSLRNIGSYKG